MPLYWTWYMVLAGCIAIIFVLFGGEDDNTHRRKDKKATKRRCFMRRDRKKDW